MLGDDAELTAAVRAAQDGDESAFRAVYRAVHPRLLGYVRTLVGDPDAEDVAERVERRPMFAAQRRAFLKQYGPGVLLLVRTSAGNAPIVLPFAKSE